MNLSLGDILLFIIALAISISLHEAAHALVASLLGDGTAKHQGRISLNPLDHIDPITTVALPLLLISIGAPPFAAAKPVPIDPRNIKYREYGVALVSAAGPLSNLLLAVAASFLLKLINPSLATDGVSQFLVYFIQVNVGLGIFNLIPFPPLDGSRILYLILPDSIRDIFQRIEQLGFASIAIFMFLVYPLIKGPLVQANNFFLKLFI